MEESKDQEKELEEIARELGLSKVELRDAIFEKALNENPELIKVLVDIYQASRELRRK